MFLAKCTCGQKLKIPSKLRGTTVNCPACGAIITTAPAVTKSGASVDKPLKTAHAPELLPEQKRDSSGSITPISSNERLCRYCSRPVSSLAFKCPHCGNFNPSPTKPTEALVGLIVLAVLIYGCTSWFPSRFGSAPARVASGTTSAAVRNSELQWFRNQGNGKEMQMLIVILENTGSTPVRVVDADITARDSAGRILGQWNYTLYAAFDMQPGIPPGSTNTTPAGEGFFLPIGYPGLPGYVEAKTVDVRITSVLEHSGM